jgi:histidinol-phosphate aminotransferase
VEQFPQTAPISTAMLRVPAHIELLEPYVPGWMGDKTVEGSSGGASIYLASNENPLGCSPAALQAMRSFESAHRYPRGGVAIRHKLADHLSLNIRHVIVGNGSDSLIGNIVRTFAASGDEVVTSASTFPSFSVQAKAHGISVRTIPYKNWVIDLPAIAAVLRPSTKIVYLPNPNNPTGTMFSDAEFRAFHAQVPASTLVILDQAYYEYAVGHPEYPALPYLEFENVITLRTFSKAHGLAGLRLGYGLASAGVIAQLHKTQLTFDTNSVAQAAGIAALDDHDFLRESVESNQRNRALMLRELRSFRYEVVPSEANFVMLVMSSAREAEFLGAELLKREIAVRVLRSFGLPRCIRITVGTDEETQTVLREMKELRAVMEEKFMEEKRIEENSVPKPFEKRENS